MKCFLKQISIVGMEVFLLFMLFNSGLCQDYITIFRREGFQEDTFTIPDKSCDRSRVSETCIGYGAVDAGDPAGCKCLCSAANVVGTPGFFYTNGKWRCISQKSIRASQGEITCTVYFLVETIIKHDSLLLGNGLVIL